MPVAFGDGHGVGNPGEGAQGREPTGGTQGRETVLAKYLRRELIRGTIIPSDFYQFGLWNQANRPLGKSSR